MHGFTRSALLMPGGAVRCPCMAMAMVGRTCARAKHDRKKHHRYQNSTTWTTRHVCACTCWYLKNTRSWIARVRCKPLSGARYRDVCLSALARCFNRQHRYVWKEIMLIGHLQRTRPRSGIRTGVCNTRSPLTSGFHAATMASCKPHVEGFQGMLLQHYVWSVTPGHTRTSVTP